MEFSLSSMPYSEDSIRTQVMAREEVISSSGRSNSTPPPAAVKLSERLEYRLPYTKEVFSALQDGSINLISINCGKIRGADTVTTKEFIERVKQTGLFEEVVVTVVSLNPDLRRIQREIADMLELNLEQCGSLFERAKVLHARLSKDYGRLLVILADVRNMPNLEAIGIPYDDTDGRCKIIFMSGLRNVTRVQTKESNSKLLLESPPKGPIAFQSRNSLVEDIMDALADDQINPLVICGKEGVGKTTLVKEVGQRAKAGALFDEVVTAVFTSKLDLKRSQNEIADCLGLTLTEQSSSARANTLCRRLSGDRRVLVILDNVSAPLNLEELGIPIGCDRKRCKVLASSRNEDTFNDMVGTKKNFRIGALLEEEAWSLFRELVGSSIESPELQPVAQQILSECAGSPIAIATVGRALHHKSQQTWNDALKLLRKAGPGKIQEVYWKTLLSYECLESEEAKEFFLLCCFVDHGRSYIPIEALVRVGRGVNLFKGIDSEAAWNHVETLIAMLKSCLLLLDSEKEGCVKVHNVVCNVGLSIAASKYGEPCPTSYQLHEN